MSGKITFQFDDGFLSHYTGAFPVFREAGVPGCLALPADPACGMGFARALEMQDAGWEILCHTVHHPRMSEPMNGETAALEIEASARILREAGFCVRQFVTPMSVLHKSMRPLVQKTYDAAFTVYRNSKAEPIENLIISRPADRFALHRCCLSGKTDAELRAYVDYVAANDAWLVFYDHDLGKNGNFTPERLRTLLACIREKGVRVMTSTEALRDEPCRTKIIAEGWDGKECFVHARMAVHGDDMLITAQKLNVFGDDCFDTLHANVSRDGGKTWTGFLPDAAFSPTVEDGIRSVCCDMTPVYHKKTGRFLVIGHTAQYRDGEIVPMGLNDYRRVTPYAVFNAQTGKFGKVQYIRMPDPVKYVDCGSGCSQCEELENGDLLVPVSFREPLPGGGKANARAAVLRCTFDGEMLTLIDIGNELEVKDEVRGIGECSVAHADGRYYLTVRGDTHGYVSVSDDGLHYTDPAVWHWDDGEVVPTYNTQSHFFTQKGKLYLVYTRKNGHNDHVFRHRAPLYVAQVDTARLCLLRETEFVATPERGARCGNFGACVKNESEAFVIVSEWMQPLGCEKYGSDNAVFLTDIRA